MKHGHILQLSLRHYGSHSHKASFANNIKGDGVIFSYFSDGGYNELRGRWKGG